MLKSDGDDDYTSILKAKYKVSELEDKYLDSLKAQGEEFDDPRVPTPEKLKNNRVYPNLSIEVEKMLLK